ncbi:MAG: HD domain-containing protein [Patescibacteria group bacterium]|nr:HD domain-containing protein [Patescibacteria group bacterium]
MLVTAFAWVVSTWLLPRGMKWLITVALAAIIAQHLAEHCWTKIEAIPGLVITAAKAMTESKESVSERLVTAIAMLSGVLTEAKVCPTHGIDHAIRVSHHARMALRHWRQPLTENQRTAVILAALLHDADDRKFFPTHKDYENARATLKALFPDIEDLVVKMITYVSASSNRNEIPAVIQKDPSLLWMLVPRWADRLEATGYVCIVRCWDYNAGLKRPLFTEKTPVVKTEEELWKVATKERYAKYNGGSDSMIDHYDDKLLHMFDEPTHNEYIDKHAKKRREAVIAFRLSFDGAVVPYDAEKFAKLVDQEFRECFN